MKLRNMFAVALAGLALTACSNDEVPGQETPVEGTKTYIGLTMQLPKGTTTKAAVTGSAEENRLTKLYVYCWTGMNIGTPKVVDVPADGVTATVSIEGVVGNNNIFVTSNTSAAISGLTATGVTHTSPQELTMNLADLTDPTKAANGFVMFSKSINVVNAEQKTQAEVTDAGYSGPNAVSIELRRAVAQVKLTSSLTNTTSIADAGGYGTLTNIMWNIANQPTTIYPVAKFVTAGTGFVAGNVISPFTAFEAGLNIDPTINVPANGAAASVLYCKENAHGGDAYLNSNTTAIKVMATFSPSSYINAVTAGTSGKTYDFTTASDLTGDFYVLNNTDAELTAYAFFDKTAADQYIAIAGGDLATKFTKYTDGKCYWSIPIHDGATPKVYGVLRNNQYTVNITSITAPGLPAFPTDNNPIAAETWIKVSVSVEAWNGNDMSDVELK